VTEELFGPDPSQSPVFPGVHPRVAVVEAALQALTEAGQVRMVEVGDPPVWHWVANVGANEVLGP
jgi:hypothetical protein